MTLSEQSARAYCYSINADPDEIVWGYRFSPVLTLGHRWRFYARSSRQLGGVA